ncbi:hypothetical protein PENANT_c279G11703, partial [Penicillium antarcticum]
MFALFMNPARGPGPALGQKSRPGPSTGLENPAQNPTQPGLGPGWARVELVLAVLQDNDTSGLLDPEATLEKSQKKK